MKYFSKITLGLTLCMGIISPCKDDDEMRIDGIPVDKEEIAIDAEGGTEKITVSSNDQWVVRVSKSWIAVSPVNGFGSAVCELTIGPTLTNVVYTAQISFTMNGRELSLVTVTQFGSGKQTLVKEPEVEIPNSDVFDNCYFKSIISTNVNFKIGSVDYSLVEEATMAEEEKREVEGERNGWVVLPKDKDLAVNLDEGVRPRILKTDFRWGVNVAPYTCVAKIHLVPVNENDQLVDNDGNKIDVVMLAVTQKAVMKVEDNRAGDSLVTITISSKLQNVMSFGTSESMINWSFVTLWEATDKETKGGIVPTEAVGRVRSVSYAMIDLQDGETFPKEIRHLKYLEPFSVQSSANRQIRTISLGEEICELEYPKDLTIFSFGINALPENFIRLGKKLENLDLVSNNFQSLSVVIDVMNEKDFPHLRYLTLTGCRATETLKDMSLIDGNNQYNGRDVGLYADIFQGQPEREVFLKLLTRDKLISLQMSYNFLEGESPTDAEVRAALRAADRLGTYQPDDFFSKDELTVKPPTFMDKISRDTCQWLLMTNNQVRYRKQTPVGGQGTPRVLPSARTVHTNSNSLTGALPNRLLFHPYSVYRGSESMIFNQQEDGRDSKGNTAGLNNVDIVNYDFSYYYGSTDPGTNQIASGVAYSLYLRKFISSGTIDQQGYRVDIINKNNFK